MGRPVKQSLERQKPDKPYSTIVNIKKTGSPKSKIIEKPGDLNGFKKGLKPEKILGATYANDELLFLMKWSGKDEADLVRSAEARTQCPHVVIEFYEKNLTWQHTTHKI